MNGEKENLIPTPSQTVGPYFRIGLTPDGSLGKMAKRQAQGEHIRLVVRVLDGDGVGVPDSMVELWQADANGKYDHPDDTQDKVPDPAFSNFGRLEGDAEGRRIFETVKPGPVPGIDGSLQAPHVCVHVFARGILWHVSTRIYFEGDPANEQDAVLRAAPTERRGTLMARRDASAPGTWSIDFRLCGKNETVFFEI